ncbi:ES2 protein, putative [Hepatocystis sp. ex Piliocolobus tephrosceles]|nr:ES2 protein, putative [Hepatocystis sp. ex Piliocolobus tephrosceles]
MISSDDDDEQLGEKNDSNKNKILLKNEKDKNIVSLKKKKKKNSNINKIISINNKEEDDKKKKNDILEKSENEKVVLYENNEIVEYDASRFGTIKKKIVLNEDDYLNTLEYLIEKRFYPDLHKLRNEKENKKGLKFNNISNEQSKQDLTFDDSSIYNDSSTDLDKVSMCLGHNECGSEVVNSIRSSNIISPYSNNIYLNNKQNNYTLFEKSKCNNIDILSSPNCSLAYTENSHILENVKKNYKLVFLPNGDKHKINLDTSLSDFHKKYTSEDNASFEYLIKNMEKQKLEKNLYSLIKREKYNEKIKIIEEYTKEGKKCDFINTNIAEDENKSMHFSSSFKISSNIENEKKKNKIKILYENTRFSNEYNKDIENQVNRTEQIKEIKLLNSEKEVKENQMITQGKFNLLKGNDKYEYLKTPLTHESDNKKGSDDNYSNNSDKDPCDSKQINNTNYLDGLSDDEFNLFLKNEFRLQQLNKREQAAEKLQNRLKNMKYNKELLKKKKIKSLINKNYSSFMSSTSFRTSVLSRHSQKRLNELALKSSLASSILKKKKKNIN